ncbi:MAG: hypothetical protein WA843_02085 [Candidatus Saccharimonadales bacterium]
MKAVALVGILAAVCLWIWWMRTIFVASLEHKRKRAIEKASWNPFHESIDGYTHVMVRLAGKGPQGILELERQDITQISDTDPEYNEKFLQAMSAARERAATLNSERQLPS